MKINSIQNMNFKALSTRAATIARIDAIPKGKEAQIDDLMVQQAENKYFHIDFQNNGFFVCKVKTGFSRLAEATSKRVVTFQPVSYRYGDIYAAAKEADKLEKAHIKIYDDNNLKSIYNYTI